MLRRTEMDERISLADQLAGEVGPVILVNTFKVAPEDIDKLLQAWAAECRAPEVQAGLHLHPAASWYRWKLGVP
jgi:hypothetical protein